MRLGLLNRIVLVWVTVALVFWAFYLAFVSYSPTLLYFYIWTAGVGAAVWFSRERVRRAVRGINLGERKRFVLLGYLMVLSEEVVAAFVNNLSEGFSLQLFAVRVLQFWALNLLAFTGWIVAWSWVSRTFLFSLRERFYLSGLFGLYSEKTIFVLFSNPLAFFFFAPLEILTYGLILSPAQLSVPSYGSLRSLRVGRYIGALALPILASIPFVLILMILRAHFPWAFPPAKLIPA